MSWGPSLGSQRKGVRGASPILVSLPARPPFWLQHDLVADLPYLPLRLQSWDLPAEERTGPHQALPLSFPRRARSLAGQPGIYLPRGMFCPASHPSLEGGSPYPALPSEHRRWVRPGLPHPCGFEVTGTDLGPHWGACPAVLQGLGWGGLGFRSLWEPNCQGL